MDIKNSIIEIIQDMNTSNNNDKINKLKEIIDIMSENYGQNYNIYMIYGYLLIEFKKTENTLKPVNVFVYNNSNELLSTHTI
jgi:hypothetical protein